MGTKVSSVLKHKGHDVVTVAPQQTVTAVVKVLTQNRIGAVPVVNERRSNHRDHLRARHHPRNFGSCGRGAGTCPQTN